MKSPWIVPADTPIEGPYVLPLESGVVRPVQIFFAERMPAACGFGVGALMIITALYGELSTLYYLLLVIAWHGFWVQAARRDPQYGAVMWRAWWESPLPEQLEACPDIGAPRVKREASVPVRGEEGAHVTSGGKAPTQQGTAPLNGQGRAPQDASRQVYNERAPVVYAAATMGESSAHTQYQEELTRRFPVHPQVQVYRAVIPPREGEE